jgi:phosphoglycolate phosphatase
MGKRCAGGFDLESFDVHDGMRCGRFEAAPTIFAAKGKGFGAKVLGFRRNLSQAPLAAGAAGGYAPGMQRREDPAMRPPIIVFDLDGTLIDTAPDLIDSLNHALAAEGFGAIDRALIGGHVGMGGRAMIERIFTIGQRRIDPAVVERHHQIFLDHYTAGIPGASRPYPGVLEAIERAREAGFAFAICTNKPEGLAESLITRLGLSDLFGAVCGGDTFQFRKPDPRHLTATIDRAGGDVERALMVGDSKNDIETAKAAGIPVVAVDFGYTDRHVREFEPSAVISHYDELTLALVERLIAAAA